MPASPSRSELSAAPSAADSASARKRYRLGTHRVRRPEETWQWIAPLLPLAGVTRVADVTRLDRLDIPVFQAVRPASRNLSVSQGKAVTAAAARVSAAMEALELWHAEDLGSLQQATLSLREMRYGNPIPLEALRWRSDALLLEAAPLAWVAAHPLLGGPPGWLPRRMVELDFRLRQPFAPRMFRLTSSGLASGNCREEALLHGLCESIERHGVWRLHREPALKVALDPESLEEDYCRELVARVRGAGMKLALWDATWEAGVPVLVADLAAPDLPNVWRGSGCHSDPCVALARAVTEAAQSRLTHIAGARDDLTPFAGADRLWRAFDEFRVPVARRRLAELPDLAGGDVGRDLERVLEVLAAAGHEPYAVDLTRPGVGIPVVYVFVAGLREAPHG